MTGAGLPFNEDVFHDTLMKCDATYKDDVNDIIKVRAYFWTAFKMNTIKHYSRLKPTVDITECYALGLADEEYESDIDEFVDIVKESLYEEFGQELSDIWLRHVEKGDTYDELKDDCPVKNIHYQFKKIRKFIREELPKKNPRFREMLNTLR